MGKYIPSARLTNFWHASPKKGTRNSVLCQIFYYIYPTSVSILWRLYVCTYTYLTAYRLYMNYRCYQITLQVKHFYTNRERCELLTRHLSLGRRPSGDWVVTWHWTKSFLKSSFQTVISSRHSYYSHLLFLVAFLVEDSY